MITLAEFSNISRIELTSESEKVSLVKVYLQDVKVTSIYCCHLMTDPKFSSVLILCTVSLVCQKRWKERAHLEINWYCRIKLNSRQAAKYTDEIHIYELFYLPKV